VNEELGMRGKKASKQARTRRGEVKRMRRAADGGSTVGCSGQAECQHAGLLLGRSFLFSFCNFSFPYFFLSLFIYLFLLYSFRGRYVANAQRNILVSNVHFGITLFVSTYQLSLSVMVQCFSLTTKQHESIYQS
jgi:hypothetical protein